MAPRRVQRAGSQVTRNTENSVNPVSENTASIQAQPDASMNPGPAEETVEETAVLQGDSPRKGATGSTTTNDSSSDNEFAELRDQIRQQKQELKRLRMENKRRALQELIDYEKRIQENRSATISRPESNISTPDHGIPQETAPQPMPEPTHALKPPAPPAHVSEYMGKNMQEYRHLSHAWNHFERNRYYFTNDTTKVVEGTAHLCATFIRLWRQHEEEVADKPTWEDFRKFLLRQLNDPVNLRRDASQRYHDARQQDHQNVREFAAYLNQWEVQLPEAYTENQRKDHLRTRVKQDLRHEALKYAQRTRDI
ncbi:retrotransposon-like protein 1 [Aspergillus tanneri]|uniref:Retrotransposon-like protein 1 n=1 Tax=Aspergillus tanneri TaxID=1220188 RepID=A0A5M9MD85_9EURO|nr:retrotransposon-like protein 1 [Aspergillus tanneri]KAA8642489.1 retrotransposon-like protein 1 [Aspergillus tanneri]